MSSVLFVEPLLFGANPNISDNSFIASTEVCKIQAEKDQNQVEELLFDMRKFLCAKGVDAKILRLVTEPRCYTTYASKGDAIFPNNSVSFHNFTDNAGRIIHRVVILYPMSMYRRDELPQMQLIAKLERAAEEGRIKLVDLRHFEKEGRCLEGTGALNFSYDGAYVYMSRSGRTDDDILDIVCSKENLNIPNERRFVFSSAMPCADGGENLIYHTNVIGWCGKRICAWALDLLCFDTNAAREAFHRHLDDEYDCVIKLSPDDIASFTGNAFEVACRSANNEELRFLCISNTAISNMRSENRRCLERWYGAENVLGFYGEVLERRSGGSIRCSMCASFTMGSVLPAIGEVSLLEYVGVIDSNESE